jgi:hypothetical protein
LPRPRAPQKLVAVGIPLVASELWASPGSRVSSCSALGPEHHSLQLAQLEVPYAFGSLSCVLHVVLEDLLTALRGVYLAVLFLPVRARACIGMADTRNCRVLRELLAARLGVQRQEHFCRARRRVGHAVLASGSG